MFGHLPLWPENASTNAGNVDALYIFLLLVSGIMTVLIFTVLTAFAVRFRKQKGQRAVQIEGSHHLEITWSIIPFCVMLVFFVWGAVIFFRERTPPQDATEVYTVAKQWMWKFEHKGGQREINELHVPVGRDVKMIMTSQDVIHSFFVPAFRLKQDVVPGRYTTLWFHATKAGTYHLFCSQYCGTQHSGMIGWITVMEPRDYEAWMSGGAGNQPLAVTDENYVRESILEPGAKIVRGFKPVMPTFQGQVSDEQLNALVDYVKSLAGPQSGPPASASGVAVATPQP